MDEQLKKRCDAVVHDISEVVQKHGVQLGVWLKRQDVLDCTGVFLAHPEIKECFFDLQIRIPDAPDEATADD